MEIHDNVNNASTGLIKTNGGIIDFKGGGSTTIVVNNLNTSNGIQIDAGGTLNVDVFTLELTGAGAVQLAAADSLITGILATNVFDNDGNQITGIGSITNLTLENAGLIEALGGTLILNTTKPIANEAGGTLEASSLSTLEIHDNVNNASTGLIKTNGGIIDFKGGGSTTIVVANANTTNGIQIDTGGKLNVDVGILELTGAGAVTLSDASSLITGILAANVLDNDGNQITGIGSITNLTLENAGLIEALGGTLILNTTKPIANEAGGTLEASSLEHVGDPRQRQQRQHRPDQDQRRHYRFQGWRLNHHRRQQSQHQQRHPDRRRRHAQCRRLHARTHRRRRRARSPPPTA